MILNTQFDQPKDYKWILRDSYVHDVFYGLDEFDSKYLRILQAKFGCLNSYHTIPERVKMEMSPYEWNETRQKFVLNEDKRVIVQLNRLENMVVSYAYDWKELLSD
ncbi:MAG: hypothetical protein JXA77_15400 [Bacteroidales bacterium]|nr:hypothetical protein [Bacteroidales bacterium]MBN2820254.1 hypothetical protein [Bacteroidales bacterium]